MASIRTTYKGRSHRAWLKLGLRDVYGVTEEFDFVVDTGSPMELILRPDLFDRFIRWPAKEELSNFGPLPAGWFQLDVPSLVLTKSVRAYKSSEVASIVSNSHPDFAGLVGLPILRLGEYGGNASEFWFRYPIP